MLNTPLPSTSIPASYFCSITNQIMVEPVFTSDGHTYEKEAIEKWFKTHKTSPKTGRELVNKQLIPNWDKKSDITDFLATHPELYDGEEVYLPNHWKTQLISAIKQRNGNKAAVQEFLEKDKRLLTLKLQADYTAFHLAAEWGSAELTKMILDQIKKEGRIDKIILSPIRFNPIYLESLLEQAIEDRDKDEFYFLLKLRAKKREIKRYYPVQIERVLYVAYIEKLKNPFIWFVQQGIALEDRDKDGNTPLMLSAIHNKDELIEYLLVCGVDRETKNAQQKTALDLAIERGNIQATKQLLKKGFLSRKMKTLGLTPLHVAVEVGEGGMLELLLQTQMVALIDSPNAAGETGLHLAVKLKRENLIDLLLKAGANPKIKNQQGQTPLKLAYENKDFDLVDSMKQMIKAIKQKKIDDQMARLKRLENIVEQQQQERQQLDMKLQQAKGLIINEFRRLKSIYFKQPQELVLKTLVRSKGACAFQVLPDNQLVATGFLSEAGAAPFPFIKIWDLKSNQCIKNLPLSLDNQRISQQGRQACERIETLQLLPNQKLAGSVGGTIKIWDLQSGILCDSWQAHEGLIHCLARLSTGELVSAAQDRMIKIWDIKKHTSIEIIGHSYTTSLQPLPENKLAIGFANNTIKIWDLKTGDCLKTLEGKGKATVMQLLTSDTLISGTSAGMIEMWDLITGNCLETLEGHTGSIQALQLFPHGELISSATDGIVKIWDLTSGKCIKFFNDCYVNMSFSLLASGELIVGSKEGIQMWDMHQFVQVDELEKQLSDCRIT